MTKLGGAIAASVALSLGACGARPQAPRPPVAVRPSPTARAVDAGIRAAPTPDFVSREAPSPEHPLDVTFGGRVRLLGYDLEAFGPLGRGDRVRVTWYWACVAPVDEGWRLLTHLDDATGPVENVDNDGEVRRRWQPHRWRVGDYVRDEQEFEVPSGWQAEVLRVRVGVWRDAERMPLTRQDVTDDEQRALAFELPVRIPELGESLRAARARGRMTIDGRAIEPAWRDAPRASLSGAERALGTVRALWDAEALYVAFEVSDPSVTSGVLGVDGSLAGDVVRLLVAPDTAAPRAVELVVSPRGRRVQYAVGHGRAPAVLLPEQTAGWRSAVTVQGTVDRAADRDRGYVVEVAIPWGVIAPSAPRAGDTWHANFASVDAPSERRGWWVATESGRAHLTLDWLGHISFE